MNKSSLMSSVTTIHSFLDQSTSQISSTYTHRITRKPEQRSNSRRSLSRKSQEKSADDIDLSRFYVKMNQTKENSETFLTKGRNAIIQRLDENRSEKKRCPTPVPGYTKRGREGTDSTKKEKNREIQNDLMISELQKKYTDQKEKRQIFEKRVNMFQKQLKNKIKKVQQLQLNLSESVKNERQVNIKLSQLQQIFNIYENNLSQAKNNIQKMKKIMKQNRLEEAEADNQKLRKQNQNYKKHISKLVEQNQNIKIKYGEIESELAVERKSVEKSKFQDYIRSKQKQIQNLKQVIALTRSQREQILQKIIGKKEEEEFQLKLTISKLQIKINYLNRKKNEEYEILKQKKNEQVTKIRNRLCTISKQCADLKKEIQKMKRKNNLFMSVQMERSSMISRDSMSRNDDQVSLDLSPDHFDL